MPSERAESIAPSAAPSPPAPVAGRHGAAAALGPAAASPPAVARDPRIDWAAERTLLAWTRTSIAVVALGFVVARYAATMKALGLPAPGGKTAPIAGLLTILVGVALNFVAVHRFILQHRAIRRGEPVEPSPVAPIVSGVLVALIGLALGVGVLAP